jgi:hypothetical protein
VINSSQLFRLLATTPSPPHSSSRGIRISLVSVIIRSNNMFARAHQAVLTSPPNEYNDSGGDPRGGGDGSGTSTGSGGVGGSSRNCTLVAPGGTPPSQPSLAYHQRVISMLRLSRAMAATLSARTSASRHSSSRSGILFLGQMARTVSRSSSLGIGTALDL